MSATTTTSGRNDSALSASATFWLGAMVLLAQIPHYLHLPWWVSLLGASLVALRFARGNTRRSRFDAIVLALVALGSAFAIRWHFGYFLGRDPCVAFLFLLVSFKFIEGRSAKDATVLICLAGILLLTQYFYAQSLLSAIVTLPAVLVLGGALLNIRDPHQSWSAAASLRITVKLLLQGLPIAALLFLLFPRLPAPLWNVPDDALGRTGLSDTLAPGSISQLSMSDAVAFRVEFDGAIPPPSQRYWRGLVLTEFDGRRWSLKKPVAGEPEPVLAAATGPEDSGALSYTVTLEAHHKHWLFALDVPRSTALSLPSPGDPVKILGHLRSDRQLHSILPVRSTLRYRQSSWLDDGYADPLPPLIDHTRLAGHNVATDQFARELRQEHPNDMNYIQAVLDWFHNEPFHYTLQPDLLGDRPVDEFLFLTRKGFCEHYASAFVHLLRSAGIPSRIVTGYLGGEMNEDYMIVRQSDAHAWTEAWVDGRWHRFDPTSAIAEERVEQGLVVNYETVSSDTNRTSLNGGWLKAIGLRWDAINFSWKRAVVNFNDQSQERLWNRLGIGTPEPWLITTVLFVAALLWGLMVLRPQLPRFRRLSPEQKSWERLNRHFSRSGLTRIPHEGPRDYLARCSNRWPACEQSLSEMSDALILLRFGTPSPEQRQALLARVRQISRQLPSARVLRRE
ncbi:MAG: DUF3488 and transglutaminase-like domain-containing protein [Gammaproteobacteria bacterium]|nr:DUF3488 and transglutaminase-like domain-containing protein [Gammaproteobacteria bacterium]